MITPTLIKLFIINSVDNKYLGLDKSLIRYFEFKPPLFFILSRFSCFKEKKATSDPEKRAERKIKTRTNASKIIIWIGSMFVDKGSSTKIV